MNDQNKLSSSGLTRGSISQDKMDCRIKFGNDVNNDRRERLIGILRALFVAVCVLIATIWIFAPLLRR